MNHVFIYIVWMAVCVCVYVCVCVCVCCLPGEEMEQRCAMGLRQDGEISVMLWAMFYRETSNPDIHVHVTLISNAYYLF